MQPSSKALTVMAFDYGTKRIGIAVGQTVSRTATALKVISADNGKPRWREITALIDEWGPDLFVVGKPGYKDQQPNPVGEEIERFSRRLTGRYNRPVEFVDERLSSFAAAHDDQAGSNGLDAAAAKMILLTWLEQPSVDSLATS
jgi:putative Holliday junction resolvase